MASITLLDPTAETSPTQRTRLPRPGNLQGLTVGLLDIAKARGDIFLDALADLLAEKGLAVKRYRKPTFARVAPTPIRHQIASECDLLIEALAD